MNRETPPEKLTFVDTFVRGFLSFGLLGSFFGIIIYAVSKSLWATAKFNLALWIITSPLAYFRIYNPALKWLIDSGESFSQAKRKAERAAKRFALEWAILLPLATAAGAVLYSGVYPNVPLAVALVVLNSAFWGYVHARIFTQAYLPFANLKNVFWVSKVLWRRIYRSTDGHSDGV
ncbi:hypothetical protein [Thermococcus sp. Bubb.Bath]|uniref:hypothetical protein n=1 Tax=Thermococcus sp. Bubb.Bath TaxID=1638242 RepID=UPI001438D02F|nr:hypothetical protein [Thermococcus sp. Bubb.Bath]NJF25085.1 hypothetical protein [Thermococcus sp. Bubb.Bath]